MGRRTTKLGKKGDPPKTAVAKTAKKSGAASSGGGTTAAPALLPGECAVGTFNDLVKKGKRGDNLTPHHIPSDTFMKEKGVAGYTRGTGICIMMEQPATGGRHRQTSTYGRSPDLSQTPKQALDREIADARKIYKDAGLHTPQVEASLQDIRKKNKAAFPGVFD
jgi:hypothetical protein